MIYKSKETTIENVKRFFSQAPPGGDIVTLEEAFRGWGRENPEHVEAHKRWMSNELTHLKYHNLVKPVYSTVGGKKKLVKLQLTLDGKKVLGRIGEQLTINDSSSAVKEENSPVSFGDVMKMVAKLRKENPDYEITFDVKLKENKE